MSIETFQGTPCGKCGGTERYWSNGNCVPCKRARRKAERKERPTARPSTAAVPDNRLMTAFLAGKLPGGKL